MSKLETQRALPRRKLYRKPRRAMFEVASGELMPTGPDFSRPPDIALADKVRRDMDHKIMSIKRKAKKAKRKP